MNQNTVPRLEEKKWTIFLLYVIPQKIEIHLFIYLFLFIDAFMYLYIDEFIYLLIYVFKRVVKLRQYKTGNKMKSTYTDIIIFYSTYIVSVT